MPERVDVLENGCRIIQDTDGFCFGTDAVQLARFASVKPGERVMDLCTGTGIVPLLLAPHTRAADITGLELQPDVAERARRSVALSGLEERIRIVTGDLKDAAALFGHNGYDVVTCNPPYMLPGSGRQNAAAHVTAARHEVACTLEDVVRAAACVLHNGGRLYMVHRPERLADVLCTLRAHRLEPKRLQFVSHTAGGAPCLLLVEGQLERRPGLVILPPAVVSEQPEK